MNNIFKATIVIIGLLAFSAEAHCQARKLETIGFTVKDMDASVKFYEKAMAFKKTSDNEYYGDEYDKLEGIFGLRMRVVRMQLGEETIELTQYITAGGRSIPEDMQSNDLYFEHIAIVVSNMDEAYKHLRKYMVAHISTGPQTIPASNAAAAGVKAFYFQDPDRHDLELIYFPQGKGLAKWQTANDQLFLGIDHTAVSITNTDSSLRFYTNILGLEKKGESFNMGTEQAHLNNIEGAKLHITGLRAQAGAGIEFLEYLHPGPGRPFPAKSQPNDIWHWQISLQVNDAKALYNQLNSLHYTFVSTGIVTFKSNGYLIKSFIVRDPDGHSLLLSERSYSNLPTGIRY